LLPRNTIRKGLKYAYRDRKNQEIQALWIQRIQHFGARQHGLSYSVLIEIKVNAKTSV